jgi:hypothetical protein
MMEEDIKELIHYAKMSNNIAMKILESLQNMDNNIKKMEASLKGLDKLWQL